MFIRLRPDIIYRNYGSFGYITDNRNYEYKFLSDQHDDLGEMIVSESGMVFLEILDRRPKSLDQIVSELKNIFGEEDVESLRADASEFCIFLKQNGFLDIAPTFEECCHAKRVMFKSNVTIMNNNNINIQDYFTSVSDGKPQLTQLHMEVISECNERCIHCYIPHEKKNTIMDIDQCLDILDQAREMQVLNVTISGGEPLLHNDIIAILHRCYEYNFSVNLLSNLTMVNDEIVLAMKENPLLSVQTSLYAVEDVIHDGITKVKGSCEKTKAAIELLVNNGIPVQISCPIMKQNLYCYEEVIKWGREHDINVNSDYVIIGQYNHLLENLNCRLSIEDVSTVIQNDIRTDSNFWNKFVKQQEKRMKRSAGDPVCSVCFMSLCVAPNGDIYPCAGWQGYKLGNIRETRLDELWNESEKVTWLRGVHWSDFPKCMKCDDKDFCTMCLVRNANEDKDGNPLNVCGYFCQVAKLHKKLFMSKQGHI